MKAKLSVLFVLSIVSSSVVDSFTHLPTPPTARAHTGFVRVALCAAKAGSFFNQVPDEEETGGSRNNQERTNKSNRSSSSRSSNKNSNSLPDFETSMTELLRRRKSPPRASVPSTINGIPTSQIQPPRGFASPSTSSSSSSSQRSPAESGLPPPPSSSSPLNSSSGSQKSKPFIGVGPPLNDITAPEYDDQGYTLYADERTGKKSRVFEALVEYPCDFTLKIVGANEGAFVAEMVELVAESCQVSVTALNGKWTSRLNGKWISVTVQAPVQSAAMLYALYENVDRDPRVKFKF